MKASGMSCITQQKQHGLSLLRSFKPENSSACLKAQRQKSDLHSSPQQSSAYERKCCKLFWGEKKKEDSSSFFLIVTFYFCRENLPILYVISIFLKMIISTACTFIRHIQLLKCDMRVYDLILPLTRVLDSDQSFSLPPLMIHPNKCQGSFTITLSPPVRHYLNVAFSCPLKKKNPILNWFTRMEQKGF